MKKAEVATRPLRWRKSCFSGLAPFIFSTLLVFLFAIHPALAQDCSWTEPLVAHQNSRASLRSPFDRANAFTQGESLRKQVATGLFQSFLSHRLPDQLNTKCLDKVENSGAFLQHVQAAFLQQSLRLFRSAKSPRLRQIASRLGVQTETETTLFFRLAGDRFAPPPTDLKAGFHRATGSIFMDLDRTGSDEWLLILAHELLHDLDELIPVSLQRYSNAELVRQIIDASRAGLSSKNLSAVQRKAFKDWIHAGMDRGLLAEVRAWTATIYVYEDGLREGLWGHISWMDEVLMQRQRGESWPRFMLRFLAARSEQPHEGVFSHALTRELLKEVKQELLTGHRTLQLGSLALFIGR